MEKKQKSTVVKPDNTQLYKLAFDTLHKEEKKETQPDRAIYNFVSDFLLSFPRKHRKNIPTFVKEVLNNLTEIDKDKTADKLKYEKSAVTTYNLEYGKITKKRGRKRTNFDNYDFGACEECGRNENNCIDL